MSAADITGVVFVFGELQGDVVVARLAIYFYRVGFGIVFHVVDPCVVARHPLVAHERVRLRVAVFFQQAQVIDARCGRGAGGGEFHGDEFLKKYATPSELLALVNAKKKNNEWRTVYTVNSNSIKFKRPNGSISSIFFDEKGQRTFYKMKLGNGTCYLSYLINEDEKNPYTDDEETTYSHGFIFYYIEN